jgi:hypothetical protein
MISVLETVLSPKDTIIGDSLPEHAVQTFINAANFIPASECGGQRMSFEDFREWCNLVPSLKKFLGSLLTSPVPRRWRVGSFGC